MSRRPTRHPSDDEAALFRQAVSDAAPLTGRDKTARPEPRLPERRLEPRRPRPQLDDMPEIVGEAPKAPARPLDRATHTRLRRGRQEIEARIDLHGMTAAAAHRNLRAFLRASQMQGRRAVLVITGRGEDPQGLGRGVLKRETPHWLDAMSDIVAGYGAADRRHGGAGALYVQLRRRDKAGRK